MSGLAILLISLAFSFLVATLISVMVRLFEGHFPQWYFAAFLSWWWPLRSPSAATLLAMSVEGEGWKDWEVVGYDCLRNGKLNASLDFFLKTTASINGSTIPLREWDRFVLRRAYGRWKRGAVFNGRKRTDEMVAAAIMKTYGDRA